MGSTDGFKEVHHSGGQPAGRGGGGGSQSGFIGLNSGAAGAIGRAKERADSAIDNGQITNDLMVSGSNEYNRITIADTYTILTRETAIYPNARSGSISPTSGPSETALAYVALGLVGEAGEIANKVKKVIRDDDGILSDEKKQAITEELGDVMWYVARLCDELGVDLSKIMADNVNKLFSRKNRGVLGGSGDQR